MKIIVCPLNWGLGHATRCVPLIRRFLSEGHEVVVATDGYPLNFLQQEFSTLRFIERPSYNVRYSSGETQIFAMLRNIPSILKGIRSEHRWLKDLMKTENFDYVISDNRFGMWTKQAHCIYITHQLMVKMPRGLKILEPLAWLIHRQIINHYAECWVPDEAGTENFSGDLSHKYPLPRNAKFIGILSRFQVSDFKFQISNCRSLQNEIFDIVAIVSGIEPQRTVFEKKLIEKYQFSEKNTLIIQGKPAENKNIRQTGKVTIVPHLPHEHFIAVLKGAKQIIARSGYSTIMDLKTLDCLHKAEFYPTPGQTEQEYLKSHIKPLKEREAATTVNIAFS